MSDKRKMRILQLVKWLSPREDNGGKIRAFNMGRALAAFAAVDVVGYVMPGELPVGNERHLAHYERLHPVPICRGHEAFRQAAAALAGGLSIRTARFFPGYFGRYVEKIMAETDYDAIQVEELPLMSSISGLPVTFPVIYSSHNVESELATRFFAHRGYLLKGLATWERNRTLREEKRAVNRSLATLAVSERDRETLASLSQCGGEHVYVLPNCAQDRIRPLESENNGRDILVLGSFGWYPNKEALIWFIEEVLPLLRSESPDAVIKVVGSGIDHRFSCRLAQQGIEVHADVPDSLPFLQQARLLVVPLRIGGGTRIKILEAWAAGLPIVSTSLGAEGIPYRSGADILIADDAVGFATAIRELLHDDNLYRRIRQAGLKQSTEFRWSSLEAPLKKIYEQLLINR